MTSRPPIGQAGNPPQSMQRAGRDRSRLRALALIAVLISVSALGVWLILRADARHGAPQARPASCFIAGKGANSARAAIRIRVLNATSRVGLASGVAAQLRLRGYTVIGVGNDPTTVPGPAVMRYGTAGAPAAKALAGLVKGAVSSPVTRTGGDVDLVLGNAFTQLASATPQQQPSTPGCPGSATPAP